ncbi:MAG TPA: hypothetical protein VK815_08860 [Candidatus Acidoferrales bacterium]|jgi:hypothetical protein|nr:hypothetical protein [Candidatus Acidoferrales bacterium]
MIATSDPDMLIAWLAIGGLVAVFCWRFLVWIREAPVTPDPWDAETEKKMSEPETPQACHRCSTPLTATAWFCPHCGSAVGPYNNMMPYVQIFSEGEVFRNGMNQRFRNRPLIVTGYVLITLGMAPILAPLYLILLFRNLGSPEGEKTDQS